MKTKRNEKTQRRVLGSVHESEAQEQAADVSLPGMVVSAPTRKPRRAPDRAPSRVRVSKRDAEANRFRKRAHALLALGIKPTQLAPVVGLSYTGFRRTVITGEIQPSLETVAGYHRALTKWCKQVGAI